MSFIYIFAGFGVGLLVGMPGVGGGSLMTPLLTLLVGSVPGITLGSMLARVGPEKFRRVVLALTLTTVAYKMIQ